MKIIKSKVWMEIDVWIAVVKMVNPIILSKRMDSVFVMILSSLMPIEACV